MDTISKIINDSLPAKTEELQICQYCCKPYTWFEKEFLQGKKIRVQVPTCNCRELEEQRKEAEKQAQRNKEMLAKKFENSLITPFFKEKTFNNLKPNAQVQKCQIYAKEFDPQKSDGILMIGRPGTGKTSILAAVCNDLLARGFNCLFITFSSLLDKFSQYSYENAGNISTLLNWLVKFDFIVIDDIGRENYTDRRKEIAFRIVDTLLNYKKVVAFTANPDMIDKLKQIDEWGAILDRLKDICAMQIKFNGESLRGRTW